MGSLRAMPAVRRFDLDELVTRPGTYFNPETEIVLIVDDSASVDLELLDDDADDDAADWILLGDDPAVDEHRRDELVEAFETRRARSTARGDARARSAGGLRAPPRPAHPRRGSGRGRPRRGRRARAGSRRRRGLLDE